jgi:hypothetical protein
MAAAPAVVPAVEKGDEYSGAKAAPAALPKEFAFVFSLPYGIGDEFPREPEEFDRMLGLLKGAGFNTVHCPPADWRPALFKKHGMKMMVDVLAWDSPVKADIRRNEEQRARLKKFVVANRDSDAIWGYNLWNERLDWVGDFKQFDLLLRMLRTWDPNHPVWVGTYTYYHAEGYPSNPGVHGYYDYHWARGHHWHFNMLNYYRELVAKRQGTMGRWMGLDGYNRSLFTLNTSIAYGLKTGMWFIGGPYASREPDKSKRWNDDYFLNRIGRHMHPTYKLIGEMGNPKDVFSTATKRSAANQKKELAIPDKTIAFPEDHWLQIRQGEVVCGFFKLPDKSDVVWVANHNAYGWQGVVMEVRQNKDKPLVVSEFNREKRDWEPLGARGLVNFAIPPADARVFRFEPGKPGETKLVTNRAASAADYDPKEHFDRIAKLLRERGELTGGKQPVAVYTHPATRTRDNRDQDSGLPKGAALFPDDFPILLEQGELLAAVFALKAGGHAICYANHNALAWQGGLVVPEQAKDNPTVISELDQEAKQWVELGSWNDVNFPVPPAGSAVFKFEATE